MALRTLVLLALLPACSTSRAQLKEELGKRASDTLGCAEGELQYKELDRMISTTKVKVSGCGRSVTYRLVESQWARANEE